MPEENNKYLSMKLFTPLYLLIFTIILAVVGWFAMAMDGQNNTIDKNRNDISEVKGDIKSINTYIATISKSMDEIKDEIKNKK